MKEEPIDSNEALPYLVSITMYVHALHVQSCEVASCYVCACQIEYFHNVL